MVGLKLSHRGHLFYSWFGGKRHPSMRGPDTGSWRFAKIVSRRRARSLARCCSTIAWAPSGPSYPNFGRLIFCTPTALQFYRLIELDALRSTPGRRRKFRLKQWEREAQKKHRCAPKKAHWRMQRDAAAQRGILVEKTSRGWMVSLPDGRRVGPFRNPNDTGSRFGDP